MRKAVILAAGRGTRMRRDDRGASLDDAQRAMADRGLKALIPFHGRPYFSYVMSAVADAGFGEICIVVRPGADPVRSAYEDVETERLRIAFAVQEEPLGSANAVLAAEDFADREPFLLINADNYYPAAALERLRELEGSGLLGFRREALLSKGGIPADRVAAYALVTADDEGYLERIVEKPGPDETQRLAGRSWISMTCWRFGPTIFEACRSVGLSDRGEYELPDAVNYAVEALGERFRVVPSDEPVLDLSRRSDVGPVGRALAARSARL